MSEQRSFILADYLEPDQYARFQIADRALNTAIVQADITSSFEEYLEIFDEFYADDIEVTSETQEEPIRGKTRLRSLLLKFLVPLHIMAEVGGVSISIREGAIPGDAVGETHSAWVLKLVGVSGKTCTVAWRTFRRWNESSVVYERHYDQQQSGEPLTFDDLKFDTAEPVRLE
jgi:hypothetical protein